MLEWKDFAVSTFVDADRERMLSRTKVPGPPGSVPAKASDIIAALRANPEACAEVLGALSPPCACGWAARAESAERELADLQERITTIADENGGPHPVQSADDSLSCIEKKFTEWFRDWNAATIAKEQAERERDEARYWLDAHKEASEALVDPVTGEDFFMLIGKGEHGEDGWFFTFGGPYDSYTLCGRHGDDETFSRERYDHDQGGWVDGCECVSDRVVDGDTYASDDVLRAELAVAESALDALKAKLAEAEREVEGAESMREDALRQLEMAREVARLGRIEAENGRKSAKRYQGERDEAKAIAGDLRARLTAAESVVEAARYELRAAISSANGIDHDGPGSASFSRIFPEDAYPTTEPEADAFVKARMRLWLHTWVTAPMRRALDALKDSDSPVEVAATACDHKRQRCENDHAVCRDCGAVNRAVTGVVDWGPPRNRPR